MCDRIVRTSICRYLKLTNFPIYLGKLFGKICYKKKKSVEAANHFIYNINRRNTAIWHDFIFVGFVPPSRCMPSERRMDKDPTLLSVFLNQILTVRFLRQVKIDLCSLLTNFFISYEILKMRCWKKISQ